VTLRTLQNFSRLRSVMFKKHSADFQIKQKITATWYVKELSDDVKLETKVGTVQLNAIITTRANKAILHSLTHVQFNIDSHRIISDRTYQQTMELLQTAKEEHQDTTNMKVLTQISTLFLPATLVAVS
jgi:Mg2+ and Co2+ transporter CorA